MATFCIENALGYSTLSPLTRLLADRGHQILTASDIDAVSIDALIFLAPASVTGEVAAQWLSIVNKVSCDIIVTEAMSSILPADLTLPVATLDTGAYENNIIDRIGELLSPSKHGLNLPKLIPLPNHIVGEYIAETEDALYQFLSNPNVRVLGAHSSLLRKLTTTPPTNRREYDLFRYVRWSADRMDTAFVKLSLRLAGGDSTSSSVERTENSLVDILTDSRSSDLIVMKGIPGSGKTLQLRYLDTYMAVSSIRNGSTDADPLAFCVSLSEHAVDESEQPLDWLRTRWARRVQTDRMQTLDARIRSGNLLLLLDGFNEIPFGTAEDRRRWMLRWKRNVHEEILGIGKNRAVVACRSRDLNVALGEPDSPPTTVDMLPLNKSEILALAARRNPGAAHQLEQALNRDPSLVQLYRTPFSLIDFLEHTAENVPRTQSEIFWRRIVAVLARERERLNYRLFDDRWLPDAAITRLLEAGSIGDAIPIMRGIPLLATLGLMAHSLTAVASSEPGENHSYVAVMDLSDGLESFREWLHLPDALAAQDALYAAIDLDLLTSNEGIVRFQHQTLQEFFAASTLEDEQILAAIDLPPGSFASKLGKLDDIVTEMGPGDELQLLPSTGFEEVFARAAELRPALIGKAVGHNPWLSAERLRVVHMPLGPMDEVVWRIIGELRSRLDHAADIRERSVSLFSLGTLELTIASRHQHDLSAMLPQCVIPADTWQLGCSTEVIGSSRAPRTVNLPKYNIAMYPVTNKEYQLFIDDGGYDTRRFWNLEGWLWRSGSYPLDEVLERWLRRRDSVARRTDLPLRLLRRGIVSIPEAAAIIRFGQMSDQEVRQVAEVLVGTQITGPEFAIDERFSNPLQPVVGVSWHEASAFCRWLSEHTDRLIRLPTEDEWEAAALYARRTADPEANASSLQDIQLSSRWRSDCGNTAEAHIGRPTPVGCFHVKARDDAIQLPSDMAGNVFEWVTDAFKPGEEWRRVCKGGSWRHLMRRAHPGYRGRGDITTRNDDNGFRVVMIEEQ